MRVRQYCGLVGHARNAYSTREEAQQVADLNRSDHDRHHPGFCQPCQAWHLFKDTAAPPSPKVVEQRRVTSRVETLEAVLIEVWRWTTRHHHDGHTLDQVDVEVARAILLRADVDFELQEALDRLVVSDADS